MNILRLSRILAFLAMFAWLLLLLPQPNTLIVAGAVALLTLPVFRWFRARMNMVCSLSIYFMLLALCVILPTAFVTVLVAPQAVSGYKTILAWSSDGFALPPFIMEHVDTVYAYLIKIPNLEQAMQEISNNFHEILNSSMRIFVSGSISFAGNTLNLIFQIFLVIFIAGLAVLYAPTLRKLTIRVSTLPPISIDRFIYALRSAVQSIVLGFIFVSLTQGLLTGLGLAIFGVRDVAFWSMIAIFCAIIPIFGTALVWVPMAFTAWINGEIGNAIGIVAWGMLVVAGSDNFLRPYMLKTGIQTSIIVLLLAIICSLIAFGPIGVILGPMLVAFAIQAVYESDYLYKQAHQKQTKILP